LGALDSLGSIVYINRHSPAPPAPPSGSSEDTILEYDRANLWVAKVLEVRAKDNQHVYLRVFYQRGRIPGVEGLIAHSATCFFFVHLESHAMAPKASDQSDRLRIPTPANPTSPSNRSSTTNIILIAMKI
jgi:hypothetical protein